MGGDGGAGGGLLGGYGEGICRERGGNGGWDGMGWGGVGERGERGERGGGHRRRINELRYSRSDSHPSSTGRERLADVLICAAS